MVAAGAAHHVELVEGAGEVGEGDVVVEVAGHEPEALGELLPDLLAELRAGVLLDRVVHDRGEVLVGPVAPGEADQAEARRQQAAVGQVVDRRHHLLARQVAGDPEQHHPARAGDAGQPPVLGVAQRVGPRRRRRGGRTHGSCSAHCRAWRTASRRAGPSRCRRSTGPALLGEHLPVAHGLGDEELVEGERPVGHGEVALGLAGDLEVDAGGRAALVVLPGRVQEPRTPAEGDGTLGRGRDGRAYVGQGGVAVPVEVGLHGDVAALGVEPGEQRDDRVVHGRHVVGRATPVRRRR